MRKSLDGTKDVLIGCPVRTIEWSVDNPANAEVYSANRMQSAKQSPQGLGESTRTLKAFADPVRLRLLNLLSGDWEEVCVCHLFEALGIPQPTVSRHLAYLRKHGLVLGGRKDYGFTTAWRSPRPDCTVFCSDVSAPAWVTPRCSARTNSG